MLPPFISKVFSICCFLALLLTPFHVADNHNTILIMFTTYLWQLSPAATLSPFSFPLLPSSPSHHPTHFKFIKVLCHFCYHLALLTLDRAMPCRWKLNDKSVYGGKRKFHYQIRRQRRYPKLKRLKGAELADARLEMCKLSFQFDAQTYSKI